MSRTDEHPAPPPDYHPGVFPGHHPDVPESPRRFVRRASTLSESYVPPHDDPPDATLADSPFDNSDESDVEYAPDARTAHTAYNPTMSGLSSAIPADYRARHAQREREMQQQGQGTAHP
jgi:hypothetical protein